MLHSYLILCKTWYGFIPRQYHGRGNFLTRSSALIHGTSRPQNSETDLTIPTTSSNISKDRTIMNRFGRTTEVAVSKIFPAGFGWQGGSIVASTAGYATDSLTFAVSTGMGDAIGVIIGHTAFYGLLNRLGVRSNIDMKKELQAATLLGSAAFCSGTLWQPLVLTLQKFDLTFNSVLVGTWLGCGTAFYLGLRAGRKALSEFCIHVEPCVKENRSTDAALALSIGGATGFFVGTDVAYLPDQNFLINIVGISMGTSNLTACAIAGTSTSLGFTATQSVLNFVYPFGKCWND